MKGKLIFLTLLILYSCSENDSDDTFINFKFNHKWNETTVNSDDFYSIQFQNNFGNMLSIERLRYLISDIQITNSAGESYSLNEYNLLDLEENSSLSFESSQTVKIGLYSNISFVFGFRDEYNIDGAYTDLNTANWSVPMMLGGGYHYMQLDGKYISNNGNESGYNYHAIRAVDSPGPNPTFPQETFFKVDLGPVNIQKECEITISMNIANWFDIPNTWDLNELNQMLMANSDAQILMYQNGQNVFNIESVE